MPDLKGWIASAVIASASNAALIDTGDSSTSFRYYAEEAAKALILKKHPGPMSASCFAALGSLPAGPSQDRGGSVSGFLVDPGGDLVISRSAELLTGILAAQPGQQATS